MRCLRDYLRVFEGIIQGWQKCIIQGDKLKCMKQKDMKLNGIKKSFDPLQTHFLEGTLKFTSWLFIIDLIL
jgi:hypothetical protein